MAITVFAKEHAVAETFAPARNFWRQMINARRQQHPPRCIHFVLADDVENIRRSAAQFLDVILRELRAEMPRLFASARKQIFASDLPSSRTITRRLARAR